jgi:predicted permease
VENFIICINAVAPLAGYILIGIFIKKINPNEEKTLSSLNTLLFRVFFPVVMFSNIYKADFSHSADKKLILYCMSFIIAIVIVAWVICSKTIKNSKRCGAIIQCSYRSNLILFGIPLTASIFSPENTGAMSVVCSFVVPLYNVLAVIILEYFRGEKPSLKVIIKNILKNPLIHGAIAGAIYNFLKLPTPTFLQTIVSNVSSATTVFALIALGASLKFSSLAENAKYILAGLFTRLIAVPAIATSLAYLIGFRDMQIFVVLIVTSTPVAASAYTMAYTMESDHVLTAQYVALSTVLSVFTIFGFLMLFMNLNLF